MGIVARVLLWRNHGNPLVVGRFPNRGVIRSDQRMQGIDISGRLVTKGVGVSDKPEDEWFWYKPVPTQI